jgi:hypothetical protein
MAVERPPCRVTDPVGLRRRIVDVAVQEWGYFGFPVYELEGGDRLPPALVRTGLGAASFQRIPPGRRVPLLTPEEMARAAPTIAGYWAATPQGPGIVQEQNGRWNGPMGPGVRWRYPWSAAFISWVMCESGVEGAGGFRYAIAHWSYIDQAIRARDGREAGAAFVAYDIGESPVEPGDLLCQSNRPAYRTLAERRRQLGVGARSHCDVVVEVDPDGARILAVGGNVLGAVTLKVFPLGRDGSGRTVPLAGHGRPLFAHLKLQAEPVGSGALRSSPTFQRARCTGPETSSARMAWVARELGLGDPALSALASGGC